MDYFEIYKKRLNRYGHDFQSRVQGQRERNFENYLLKSLYRVDCKYDNKKIPATLERYRQDYTETQCYLLTRITDVIPNGTILTVVSRDGEESLWMIWWLEEIEASGYNRYVVLRMTNYLGWKTNGTTYRQWGYFSGPGTQTISDTAKTSTIVPLYRENNNLHMFITPYAADLKVESYLEVEFDQTKSAYVVTDVDVNSTPGVMYVSVDPSYIRDKSEKPTQTESSDPNDFFWLKGGK